MKQYLKDCANTMLMKFNQMLVRSRARDWSLKIEAAVGGPDLQAATNIQRFCGEVNFFYEDFNLPEQLRIGGAWKKDLLERRKHQMRTYKTKSTTEIAEFHEQMFYNELIYGIWHFGYLNDLKLGLNSQIDFAREIQSYFGMFGHDNVIYPQTPIGHWGMVSKRNSVEKPIRMSDVSHAMQAAHIKDLVTYQSKRDSQRRLNFLEIGSGFGGLAHKLSTLSLFESIYLVDIPHNLATAYYYLSRTIGPDSATIVGTNSQFDKAVSSSKPRIVLVPSCYYNRIKELKGPFIVGNFGSFSEMDIFTVNFYLANLPYEVLSLIQINSNLSSLNTGGHRECRVDDFTYPERLVRVYGGASSWKECTVESRYKTALHLSV